MKRNVGRARWLFAAIPLAAISVGISTERLDVPGMSPGPAMSVKSCEKWPYSVYCYEYANHPSFGCFNTFCEATAAGFSRCTRNLKGTCD
jgi:hypothetical protein